MAHQIPRKPVLPSRPRYNQAPSHDGSLDEKRSHYLEPYPSLVKTVSAGELNKHPNVISTLPPPYSHSPGLPRQKSTPELVSHQSDLSIPSPPAPDTSEPSRSIWKTAFDETVYFAGGLLSHPYESTKHYSILRHSPALVLYRGPSTSVTISVFSDAPLPSDRSFWLQRKGFSGNMGMAASALMRTTSNWIDVTPSIESLVSVLPEADERAWQRDIKKFLKKSAKEKRLSKQLIRETCVLRIPAVADDGYLRIVMCTGQSSKKSLCPSPTFRLASISSDASVVRGASLASLPLEVGLKAASVVGNQYVQRFVGPVQGVVQSRLEKMQPGIVTRSAATIALARSGVEEHFGHLEENFDGARDATYQPFHEQGPLDAPPPVIGSDSGPENPFPMTFTGKVVPGTGLSRANYNTPTANLSHVSEDLLLRLNGVYIGWAAIEPGKTTNGVECDWHEAIITIAPSPHAPPTVTAQKVATVHIIHDFGEGTSFYHAKLRVMIMAFLRPNLITTHTAPSAAIAAAMSRDQDIAVASLSRERWRCDAGLHSLERARTEQSAADKYVAMRSQVQKHVDNVPVHWAGVRTERAGLKDEAYGRGGFYVRR
ncbi:hypothetical protein GGR50DRAFT_409480 [Xylaria sp. CBS 124048]|nr:hypothetical protein GGR50DRAFT_409480 [Xylaria sp. CBS 124048]